jgi:hypothetical protein
MQDPFRPRPYVPMCENPTRRRPRTAIALSIAGSASAASRTAYFKVSLTASQDVSWTKHLTYTSSCGGTTQLEGEGTSAIRVHTPRPQPAVAQRLRGGRIALLFGHGRSAVPVVGTVSRHGVSYATGGSPAAGPGCGSPEPPVASDCGTKPYPAGSEIGVGYYTPEDWPYHYGGEPLVRSIAISGPAAPGWHGIVFQWCPGANGDELLRGPVYEPEGAHSTPGGLAPGDLFGRARRLKVTGHGRQTVDTAPNQRGVTGTFPITTTTNWTLTFTRLARRPAGL